MISQKSLLLSLAFILGLQAVLSAQNHIVIKYSSNDCIFCNLQINSLKKIISPKSIEIVLLAAKKDDEEINNSLTLVKDEGYKIVYSDSLYYLYDSSERSTLYIINGKKIVYKEYLKTIQASIIQQMMLVDNDMGNINFPELQLTRQCGEYIYLSGTYNYILKIAKDDLGNVYDTIRINTKDFKKEVFKCLYGANFQTELDTFYACAKRYSIPNTFRIHDFQVNGDTIWTIVSSATIHHKNDTFRIQNTPFLLLYVNNKWLRTIKLDWQTEHTYNGVAYHLFSSFFVMHENQLYVAVTTDSLSDFNALLAKCRIEENTIKIDNIIPYSIPGHMLRTKIGYFMTDKIFCNGFISNVYSDEFYDLHNGKSLFANTRHLENTFNKQEAQSLRFKVNFRVISFGLYNNDFSVVYKSGDTCINKHYALKNSQLTPTYKEILSTAPFPNKEKISTGGVVCDEKGIYAYSFAFNKFSFFPYRTEIK